MHYPPMFDWPQLLWPQSSWLEKILLPLLMYGLVILLLRLVFKQGMAKVTPFDFLIILAFAHAGQIAMIGLDSSVWGAVTGASVMIFLHQLFR